jgi:hypothetical protein
MWSFEVMAMLAADWTLGLDVEPSLEEKVALARSSRVQTSATESADGTC